MANDESSMPLPFTASNGFKNKGKVTGNSFSDEYRLGVAVKKSAVLTPSSRRKVLVRTLFESYFNTPRDDPE